jgi:hypothetical protein
MTTKTIHPRNLLPLEPEETDPLSGVEPLRSRSTKIRGMPDTLISIS